MIPNYVDPDAEGTPVTLGKCRCPGAPHGEDTAIVTALFGYGDRSVIRQAGVIGGEGAISQMAILRGVKSWTLTLPNGDPRPRNAEQISRLDEGTVDKLVAALMPAFAEEEVPKGSGGRSRNGSRANAGSTRRTGTPTPSTTR